MFLSLDQLKDSLNKLESIHQFYGTTFLACKRGGLAVGRAEEFPISAEETKLLDQFYRPAPSSNYYYQVFKTTRKGNHWVQAHRYASTTLQAVRTQSQFKDVFIHDSPLRWGWKTHYVQILKAHLRRNLIPAFDLAVWLYRDKDWTESTTAEDIIAFFIDEFSITEDERDTLFDLSPNNSLLQEQLFQEEVNTWEQLKEITGFPPDAETAELPVAHIAMILENVRSLAGNHVIPIKPLTLLIGENSSGKTTFLSTISTVCNSPQYPIRPRFNDPPYNLGGYETIATFKGEHDRASYFAIGHQIIREGDKHTEVLAKYINNRGEAELSDFRIKSPEGSFRLYLKEKESDFYTAQLTPEGKGERTTEFRVRRKIEGYKKTDFVSYLISNNADYRLVTSSGRRKGGREFDIVSLIKVLSGIHLSESLSIAPIRTKPSRTYDQLSDDYSPEGSHIPYLLARILSEDVNSEQKKELLTALEQFGNESGLFKGVGVKQLGDNLGDPFQILVTPSGLSVNLQDVGYGVSQALPVIVQSVLSDTPQLMLLQQPEVHLHPKAQAALGSFFVRLASKAEKTFVIETHSDFIVDRIRQEIAAGKIDHNSVVILFFDKEDLETKVYPLTLDKMGNILNAPSTYREFFLREELNLITRTSELN